MVKYFAAPAILIMGRWRGRRGHPSAANYITEKQKAEGVRAEEARDL